MCQFDPTRERATLLALVGTKLVTPANDLLGEIALRTCRAKCKWLMRLMIRFCGTLRAGRFGSIADIRTYGPVWWPSRSSTSMNVLQNV